MSDIKATYILRSKGIDLGKVEFNSENWPWFSGRFIPFDSFSAFADIFHQEQLLHSENFKREERDKLWRQIALMELQLIDSTSGKLEGEPDLLYIHGDRIHWRGHKGALRTLYNS